MTCIFLIHIYIHTYEINASHMEYEGSSHIHLCGTITWGDLASGMWGPHHVMVPHGVNMRGTLIFHMICIFLYMYVCMYVCMYLCMRKMEVIMHYEEIPHNAHSFA